MLTSFAQEKIRERRVNFYDVTDLRVEYDIITDHKLIDKVKIAILWSVTNLPSLFDDICCKCLKLFGYIKSAGITKLCLEGMVPSKKNKKNKTEMEG